MQNKKSYLRDYLNAVILLLHLTLHLTFAMVTMEIYLIPLFNFIIKLDHFR